MTKEKPNPPGEYPVVVVGSGPGGLQTSYFLKRLGINHAVVSRDEKPGGMFQQFPLFQRLISWTKPYAPAKRTSPDYEWYDWNSLLAEEPERKGLVASLMDGTSYFPSRDEMERGLAAFVEATGLQVRFGCTWESTRKTDDGFVLGTSDGEYRCKVLVFAVGTTQPWKPGIPGLETVPHYVDTKPIKDYAGRDVCIIGKRNSGLEIADSLLPVARRIILVSPRPAKISVLEKSLAGARARYLQPYEDHVLGGGHVLVDAAIDRVEQVDAGYRVYASSSTTSAPMVFEVDEAIAATGFTTPLGDLPELGVATFNQGRLPAQTAYWESASVPGIYFAGSTTQGSAGLRKYGIGGNSAAVHGFRYNARLLAHHLAQSHFGIKKDPASVERKDLVPFLLSEIGRGPELWNQQAYLARVVTLDPGSGISDEGVVPLSHFLDTDGPDAIGVTIETDASGEIHPAAYLRRANHIEEHLFPSHPLLDFQTMEHQKQLTGLLAPYLG